MLPTTNKERISNGTGKSLSATNNPRRSGEEVDLGKVLPKRRSRAQLERSFYRAVDEEDALNRVRAWQELLEHIAADLDEAVRLAVVKGDASWSDVGRALGTSRQNAHKRFAERLGLTFD